MHQKEPVIGILGGMGPYAGIDLFSKLHLLTEATTDQEHLPIALLSYPHLIADRSDFLSDPSAPSPAPALVRLSRQLEAAGATVIGMPCNTAHAPAIFDRMQDELRREGSEIQFVHMINETARVVQEMGVTTIGVLSSLLVYRLKLYQKVLEEAGLRVVRPDEEMQNSVVNPVIFDPEFGIKAKSEPVTQRARDQLVEAILSLKAQGAEAVILGCTEFPLAIPEPAVGGVLVVDPTQELARALIRRTYPEKLRSAVSIR